MASVRITNDIRYHVAQRFQTMFQERIKTEREKLNHLGIVEACYKTHYPPEVVAAHKVLIKHHSDWLNMVDSFSIQCTYTNEANEKITATFNLDAPEALPSIRGYGRPMLKLKEDMGDVYKHAVEVLKEVHRLEAEHKQLHTEIVQKVLMQCGTLRQVLEVWPTALDFMPEGARQLHYAKAEKRAKFNTDSVALGDDTKVALMKARLITGM